ncbi:MAG TPA: hypothetical protein VJZ75_01635 [Candidatus Bathyarchaeia archaeon]|nr:hypothetical protein [Candidatus Bathyarchaeia archaeon]
MQKTLGSPATGILLLLALAGLLATTPLAMAQSTNGSFNPQTQFPVGSTVTVNSVSGLGGGMPFFNPGMKGKQIHGWAQSNPSQARNWNQTGPPPQSFTASLTLTAQVMNDTANGDILWIIKSGSIVVNGTTLTITRGMGGIGKLDRIRMFGNVTDSNGHTYGWTLEGFAAVYNGTVIASLNGVSNYNPAPPTTQQSSADKRPRGVPLSFIATIT